MENLLPFERLIWFPFLKGSPIFASTQPPLECGAAGGRGRYTPRFAPAVPLGEGSPWSSTTAPSCLWEARASLCMGLDQLGKHTWSTIDFSHLPRSETQFPHL